MAEKKGVGIDRFKAKPSLPVGRVPIGEGERDKAVALVKRVVKKEKRNGRGKKAR